MFSIIVPMYNVEKYIEKCLKSLIEQDINDYEVILVNDGSSDSSLEIAEKWANKYSQIKFHTKSKNTGLSDTRNIGLKLSRGDYVIFIDSDDYVEFNCLSRLKQEIIKSKYPDVIYTGFYQEQEGKIKALYGYKSKHNTLFTSEDFLKSELKKRNLYAAACFGIYKRELILDKNLFFLSGILHEDELWTPNLLFNSKTVYTSDIIFYHYVRRENSITKSKDKTKNGLDLLKICESLETISKTITDAELKKLMDNHIAMLYMKAMTRGKLYRKRYIGLIDRSYPLKKTNTFYDKIKALIFFISPLMYYKLDTKG